MTVTNLTRNTVLCSHAQLADSFVARARGLLGRKALTAGQGLVITRCNSIHMFFMKVPIDAVFVDRQGKVVGLVENILPNRLSPIFWSAERDIEIPPGSINTTATALGDVVEINLQCK